MTTLSIFRLRLLVHPRWLLIVGICVGGLLALRVLTPKEPAQIIRGQALAWDIVRTERHAPDIQLSSGAYMPGDRMVLYTRTTQSDRMLVRAWAQMQIAPFADRLATMPSNEQLSWVIDFGTTAVEQEVITVPLYRAADPTFYQYVGTVPDMLIDSGRVYPATAVPVQATVLSLLPTTAPVQATPLPVPPVSVSDTTASSKALLATGFDEASGMASAWLPLSGDWVAHDGIYSQRDASGYDLISMLDLTPQSHYRMQAKLRFSGGAMGGGFIYNAPDKTHRANAQTVDFDKQGSFLRWGRYDANGAYIYGGGAPITSPINDEKWHTIQLVTHATTSVVSLDGREIGTIANVSPSGYVGLLSSKTIVDFDDVTITVLPDIDVNPIPQPTHEGTAGTQFNDDFADGDAKGWQVVGGTWQVLDGAYEQTNTSGFDLGSISTFQSDHFSATVRLKRLDGDIGAGLYFNLAERDKKSRSQMINYTQGGTMMQWGHFDEGGNFVFEGSATVPNGNDGAWHTLTVQVNSGKATFTLDGKEIAHDVQLTYLSGYVGLLVSNSKIAFDDVQLLTQ